MTKKNALPAERIVAVETGGCPHAAIREDISMNLAECEMLTAKFNPDLVIVGMIGDNENNITSLDYSTFYEKDLFVGILTKIIIMRVNTNINTKNI